MAAELSREPYFAWLDSAAIGPQGRYSYLCADPFLVLEARDGQAFVDGDAVADDLFTVMQNLLIRYRVYGTGPVPFVGGAIGFFGYELGAVLENIPTQPGPIETVPDAVIGFYDLVLALDHEVNRAWLLATGFPETEPTARLDRAEGRIAEWIARDWPALDCGNVPSRTWRPLIDQPDYEARIRKTLEYIRAGDIYQANITVPFIADASDVSCFDVYTALRNQNPAPFAALLGCGGTLSLLSASPERFLCLDKKGRVEARPIKGTRPRSADDAIDAKERAALTDSDKDRAENLMIVDLLRNDLARVSVPGSVAVPALCALESFSTVHHLVSVVEAQLQPGLGPVDLLRATFPGGSVTGAPKIRAMQIIHELEVCGRGPYCGAIGWIGFDGAMDTSITIRTLVQSEGKLVAQAGGGIVADSEPAAEYAELLTKIGPLLRAAGGV